MNVYSEYFPTLEIALSWRGLLRASLHFFLSLFVYAFHGYRATKARAEPTEDMGKHAIEAHGYTYEQLHTPRMMEKSQRQSKA